MLCPVNWPWFLWCRRGRYVSVSWQEENDHLEFAIKRTGLMTDELHKIEVGQKLGVRGPYGNGFPVEECKGKNMLFIAGGIGLAPLRSFIKYCFKHRKTMARLLFYTEAVVLRTCASKTNYLKSGLRKRILKFM